MFALSLGTKTESLPISRMMHHVEEKFGDKHLVVYHDSTARMDIGSGGPILEQFPYDARMQGQEPTIRISLDLTQDRLELFRATDSVQAVYYRMSSRDGFQAASHVGLLRDLLGFEPRPNKDVLPQFLRYRIVNPPHTMYEGLSQIPAGGSLAVTARPGQTRLESLAWPRLNDTESTPQNLEWLTERCAETLTKAVVGRAPVDGCTAVLFSGGLDSTVLAQVASRHLSPVRCYSASYPFEKAELDKETGNAKRAAIAMGYQHDHLSCSTRQYLRDVIRASAASEYPIHHLQSALVYRLITRMMTLEDRYVLCGHGADAAWGPYISYLLRCNSRLPRRLLSSPLLRGALSWALMRAGLRNAPIGWLGTPNATNLEDINHPLWKIHSYGDPAWVSDLLATKPQATMALRREMLEPYNESDLYRTISWLGFLDESASTQVVWSSFGETAGRFVYYPYFHPAHLEIALACTPELKYNQPKQILRLAARRLGVHPVVMNQPKSSFGVARSDWACPQSPICALLPLASSVWDLKHLAELQRPNELQAQTLWGLLIYALWYRLHIGLEPVETLLDELEEQMDQHPACTL